jgi:hypothetical protein
MRDGLLVLSALVTVAAAIPYTVKVLNKQTKPRVVSWFNWSLLTGISAAAALADKQYPSAVLSLAACAECMAIVIFGLKLGDRRFEIFDVACQAGAIIGLVLWIVFNSPLIAIVASAAIDFIAGLPTMKHIWQKPREESPSVFILSATGAALALAAVRHPHLSGLVMPTYITLVNLSMVGLFFVTPYKERQKSRS